jgi:hypothetical protein
MNRSFIFRIALGLALVIGRSPAVSAAGTGTDPTSLYQLNAQFTNAEPYYFEVTGLPTSGKFPMTMGSTGAIDTDDAGRIYGTQDLEAPSIGGTFICDVSGSVSRIDVSTAVKMLMRAKGYALDPSSNQVPASFTLSFEGIPVLVAHQSSPVITVATNVAVISSDGSVDSDGNLIWETNFQFVSAAVTNVTPAQTNVLSYTTYMYALLEDGTLFPTGINSSNYATNIVPATNIVQPAVESFSFTNDWVLVSGKLSGSVNVGGHRTVISDPAAVLIQPHITNWQGTPITLVEGDATNVYAAVYSLLVDGNLNLNAVDSINAEVVQSGKDLSLVGTNFSGAGTVSYSHNGASGSATGTLFADASDRNSFLNFKAETGTLIASYTVNSNAPPVIVTITNSIGVPPVLSLTNTVSGILQIDDVVNMVTNDAVVIESHYGSVDLTNPSYITNAIPGAIKSISVSGRLSGQAVSASTAVNPDAQYQLLPVGQQPP